MGKRGKWLVAIKGCLTANCNAEKSQSSHKSKAKPKSGDSTQVDPIHVEEEVRDQDGTQLPPPSSAVDVKPPSPRTEIKQSPTAELRMPTTQDDEYRDHAYSVAVASAVAAEAAAVAAQAAAEVVRLTTAARIPSKSKEEIAAIKIQTVFRGYLARKSMQSSRGVVRLKRLAEGNAVKRQTATTLHAMQTLSRLQSQIQARRVRMKEENQALQRQLQLKHEREIEKLKIGEEWDDSMQSKEQIEAKIVNKYEAAIRRERSLAYAFSHQWKSSSRAVTPVFTDMRNPQWGWSWLEHWTSSRPWENHTGTDTDECASTGVTGQPNGSQAQKPIANRDFTLERTPVSSVQKSARPSSRHSPSAPHSRPSSAAGKKAFASPRILFGSADDDARSIGSLRSEHRRRHSLAGSSIRDDISTASTTSIPHYMESTESTRAKSRFHNLHNDKTESLDKVSIGSAKKRLSFPIESKQTEQSPENVRRHSGPPKLVSLGK